jgi:tetratricopeptide (TPR) repeat protein
MAIWLTRFGLLLVLALAAGPSLASAQSDGDASLPESFSEPIPLHPVALGEFTRPISSSNAQAQAYFDQGFQMMYAFAKEDAARSFREARRRDPNCAICYWGEAWAWGSYLNGPMTPAEAPFAYAAIRRARELAATFASERERAFIDAMVPRYVETFDPEQRREQDMAYAESMRRVYETYPDDLDAATLYADALFLLEPRRGTRNLNTPEVRRLHQVLEGILARDIRHPGACHLYIHATESTIEPERAEACAEFLGNSIPGASHINHMPSHTWNEIGRWGDSVRANTQAWHSDQKAAIGEGFAIYPSHNLHMLLFAASMDGQGAIATQGGKDYATLTGDSFYQALTLLRFGRFDEILALDNRPDDIVTGGLWDFAKGYAHLRNEESDFAGAYLSRVRKGAESGDARFRFHSATQLLGVVGDILEGEIERASGSLANAIASFERAVTTEDSLNYDEPEPLPFAARHWLGAALLEASRFADAERVYREELEDHPHNGWSLLGLITALEAQGKTSTEARTDFQASWARADAWIQASRF